MRALLDVNVLIALFDEEHTANGKAHDWLDSNKTHGIATCPLTENGLVRILSHTGYRSRLDYPPSFFVKNLDQFSRANDHEFWPDDLSLRDASVFDVDYMVGSKQITDLYLLGLAVRKGGRLVTLDRKINLAAVRGATAENLCVI